MLGATLVTVQTGPHGKQVNRLYIEDGSDIDKEFYLSLLVNRETSEVSFVVSTEGGVNIEDVAHKTPEKIVTFSVDPATGIMSHHGRAVAKALNLTGDLAKQAEKLTAQLYNAFVAKDMAMLEINPLVVTKQGQLRVLDAKVSFDDNALFRHPDVAALRDETEEDAKEIEASKYDLNYVALDGTIGCMVNGAGLAMATMDIIKLYGMEPANFLDVGGGASVEKVAAAFKIITADPNVKGILVNIFGGIMKCDVIAEGVVAAVKQVGLKVPLVVRLEGTNVEAGKKIIRRLRIERAAGRQSRRCRAEDREGRQRELTPWPRTVSPRRRRCRSTRGLRCSPVNGAVRRWSIRRAGPRAVPPPRGSSARMDLNGFYLIQDSVQVRDGKESFATHGVFTYDREDRTYKLFWHDSLGYYSPAPASGGWAAKSLILVRGSLRGNARHVYEIVDDNTYNMKIQFSPDAEGWNDVLTGVYRRVS